MEIVKRNFFINHLINFIPLRFIKFGTVGLSGTIVNLVILFLNQEIVFRNIYPTERRLLLSLSVAIFFATLNNFFWNRVWTWGDRKGKTRYGLFVQLGQYFLACGIAIILQYVMTIFLAKYVYYLIANVIAIVCAAVFVYIMNDIWTFALKKF